MKRYTVELMEYAAYGRYSVRVMAASADEACEKARAKVERGEAVASRFTHWDGNRPFVDAVNGDDAVPFAHGEIAVNHPSVVRLIEAAALTLADLPAESTAAVRLRLAMAVLVSGDDPVDIVEPSDPQAGLAHELRMLSRLIGTTSPQGRAESRGIAQRAAAQTERLLRSVCELRDWVADLVDHQDRAEVPAMIEADAVIRDVQGLTPFKAHVAR